MDLTYPETSVAFREKVRELIARNAPVGWSGLGGLPAAEQESTRAAWRSVLLENNLLAVQWPEEHGGAGLTALEQLILAEECALAGVPQGGLNDNFGIQMLGSTLLRYGTDEQKSHYLPRILSQEDIWCQGFSEPEAGSDLAGVRTRADLVDGAWVINGQKTWTSYGHLADHIFVLCRTSPVEESKHRGLSFLLVDMRQPGVEVRPLRTMTGEAEFNEVYFTDATCAEADIVGGVGDGWSVAMTLLGFERGEAAATLAIKFRNDFDRLCDLARVHAKDDDDRIRERLSRAYVQVEQMRYLGLRAVSQWLAGSPIGAESSLHKLFWSNWLQETTELAVDIMGVDSLVPEGLGLQGMAFPAAETGTPNTSGAWVDYYFRARAATIYAGTSEIQKNIVAERMLGLPRDRR